MLKNGTPSDIVSGILQLGFLSGSNTVSMRDWCKRKKDANVSSIQPQSFDLLSCCGGWSHLNMTPD
jgi:hypothetical protein